MADLDPSDLARSLSEIPLLRELNRLLFSQSGPVNWEIAHQIAVAIAEAGGPGVPPNDDDREAFVEACRIAELQMTGLTNLDSPTSASTVELLTRRQCVDVTLEGLRPYVERFSTKIELPGGVESGVPMGLMFQGAMAALGPLLIGVQVGFLTGYLSRRILGQYDFLLPRSGSEKVTFVFPNIIELERELDFEPKQFQLWLALHEMGHRMEFESIAWSKAYFVNLVERFIDAAEVDSGEIIARLQGLGDPQHLPHLIQNPDELLPLIMTDEQQAIATQIQTFMSVLESYVDHLMEQVAKDLLEQFERIKEGLIRRRAERSAAERLMEGLLGLDLTRENYRAGEKFLEELSIAKQVDALWASPANLPTAEELGKPSAWLSRVVFS